MSFRIAISGGHSRSQALAILDDVVIGSAEGAGLNDHVNLDRPEYEKGLTVKTMRLLSSLVDSINESERLVTTIQNLNDFCDRTEHLVVAMPGVTTVYDHARISAAFRPFGFPRIEIIDDTWAALVAGIQCCRGISAVAGTGASVYIGLDRFRVDKRYKLDGYGALLGDWGSGFRLAQRVLEEAGRFTDRGEEFPLSTALLEQARSLYSPSWKLVSLAQLQNWFDELVRVEPTEWRVKLAELASLVTKAAAEGCDFAKELVIGSSQELFTTIQYAVNRLRQLDEIPLGLTIEQLPLVLKGGQLENSLLYCETLIASVLQSDWGMPIVFSEFSPVVGAAVLAACDEDRVVPESSIVKKLIESVRKWPAAHSQKLLVDFPEALQRVSIG